MFHELVNQQRVKARIHFIALDGKSEEYVSPMETMTEECIEKRFGDVLDLVAEVASLCTFPAYNKREGAKTVRQVVKQLQATVQEESFFKNKLFVTGGYYGPNQDWGMVHPSRSEGYPYVYVGLPWAPNECIYCITEEGALKKISDPKFGEVFGPQTHQLTKCEIDAIRKVLLEKQGCAIYK